MNLRNRISSVFLQCDSSRSIIEPRDSVPSITHRSPLILCRFLCGLAPGVPSRCCRPISLRKALSTASASSVPFRLKSLALALKREWRELPLSAFRLTSRYILSEGGGGVAMRAGVAAWLRISVAVGFVDVEPPPSAWTVTGIVTVD